MCKDTVESYIKCNSDLSLQLKSTLEEGKYVVHGTVDPQLWTRNHTESFNLGNNLTDLQQVKIRHLLIRNKDLMASSSDRLGFTELAVYEIDTGNALIRSKPYKISQKEKDINQQIEDILKLSLIRPSDSE